MTTRNEALRRARTIAAVITVALGTTAAAAAPAAAQFRTAQALQRPVEASVGLGATVPVGRAGNALGTGAHALGALTLHNGALPFGVRAAVAYHRFPAKTGGSPDPTTSIVSGYGQLLGATLGATVGMPTGVARPYAMVGAGYYDFRARQDVEHRDVNQPGTITRTAERQSVSRWGLNAALGMRGGIHGFKAFVEARFDDVFAGANGAFGVNHVRFVPVTAGVIF